MGFGRKLSMKIVKAQFGGCFLVLKRETKLKITAPKQGLTALNKILLVYGRGAGMCSLVGGSWRDKQILEQSKAKSSSPDLNTAL